MIAAGAVAYVGECCVSVSGATFVMWMTSGATIEMWMIFSVSVTVSI